MTKPRIEHTNTKVWQEGDHLHMSGDVEVTIEGEAWVLGLKKHADVEWQYIDGQWHGKGLGLRLGQRLVWPNRAVIKEAHDCIVHQRTDAYVFQKMPPGKKIMPVAPFWIERTGDSPRLVLDFYTDQDDDLPEGSHELTEINHD